MALQRNDSLRRKTDSVSDLLTSASKNDIDIKSAPIEDATTWVQSNPKRAAQALQRALESEREQSALLEVTYALFQNTDNVTEVTTRIMRQAAKLIDCERCSIFQYDKETGDLYSRAFDVSADTEEADDISPKEIRFSASCGIAGHVARTGETLNIPDAYQDDRFNKKVDEETGFKTRCILCMPIRNKDKEIIGVAQLINKNGGVFTSKDEKTFKSFGVYCGLALQNASLYEQMARDATRRKVIMEMVNYHTRAKPSEVVEVYSKKLQKAMYVKLNEITFNPLDIDGDDTLRACYYMFDVLGLMDKFRITNNRMCAWLISTRRNYRAVKYHNWKHAFNVGQFIFSLCKSTELGDALTDMEKLMLLVAAFSHDVDHRGTNNAFEKKYSTELGKLYSTSTLEQHHFDRCMTIIGKDENNILSELNEADYRQAVNLIRESILATDLSVHFKQRDSLKSIVDSGDFSWDNDHHRTTIRESLMTAADLSATTKPFPAQRRTAELVYSEFFEQGDLEQALGAKESDLQDLMNRRKVANLPKMQIGFMNFVARQVYESLVKQFPSLSPLMKQFEVNVQEWQALQEQGPYNFITPVEFLV